MGKDKADKQKLAQLEAQQAADRAAAQQAMQVAAAPKPLETALDTQSMDWLNQTSGKNGPLDVQSLTAMKPYLNLYDSASQRQQGERQGLGALQMGAQGSNPMLAQLLKQQSEDQRQQESAGGLENAYRLTDAQMRGNIMPLLGLQQNRTMGLAGMSNSLANSSTGQWAGFRPAPSIWQNLLMEGVRGASQVGAAFAGSDSRLKERIRPMKEVVDKLKQIQGVSFIWNLKAAALGLDPGQPGGGVLAQDVEKVFPELVMTGSDGYRRVNYTALTGILVEAMKGLETENAQLRAQVSL